MADRSTIVNVFNQTANLYHDKYADVTAYAEGLNCFLTSLPKNGNVVELGCGPGNIAKYVLDRRADLNYEGYDLSEEMLAIARKVCPESEFYHADAMTVKPLPASLDGIILGFILPYLSDKDVVKLLNTAYIGLNDDACLYLSTMISDEGGYHTAQSSDGKYKLSIHYFTRTFILDSLKSIGFKILFEREASQPFNSDLDLIIVAKK